MANMPLDQVGGQQLDKAVTELGLELTAAQSKQLLDHLNLLVKWGKVYNLTAVRDPADMLRQHLVDSLAVIPPLRAHLGRVSAGADVTRRVLDVGSGAGFPGLTIATAMPEVEVICVDSVGKKVGFIRQVAAELGLSNARAEHSRIQELAPLNCNVISSRAFASLRDFANLTRLHLAHDGVWMAMKGRTPDDEMAELPDDVEVFHVEQLRVPDLDAERCLVWMRPKRIPA